MAFPGSAVPAVEPFRRLLEQDRASLDDVRRLGFFGVPETLRATYWKLLLDYLPLKKAARAAELQRKREQYRTFLEEVTTKPGEEDTPGQVLVAPAVMPPPTPQPAPASAPPRKHAFSPSEDPSKLSKYTSLFGAGSGGSEAATSSGAALTAAAKPADSAASTKHVVAARPTLRSSSLLSGPSSGLFASGAGSASGSSTGGSLFHSSGMQLFGASPSSPSLLSSALSSGPHSRRASLDLGGSAAGAAGAAASCGAAAESGCSPCNASKPPQERTDAVASSGMPSASGGASASGAPASSDGPSASAAKLENGLTASGAAVAAPAGPAKPLAASTLALLSVSDDPLSVQGGRNSKWAEWHRDEELRAEIEKDIQRTSPGLHFFANPANLAAMSRILFVYAKLNSGVRYVQGMNELLAPIWLVMATERLDAPGGTAAPAPPCSGGGDAGASPASPLSSPGSAASPSGSAASSASGFSAATAVGGAKDMQAAEADAFFCFMGLMAEVRDVFIKAHDNSATGVRGMLHRFGTILTRREPAVAAHLARMRLDNQFYAFRWITTLLSREFAMPDVLMLWDSLLADPYRFSYLLHTCVGMIRLQRPAILGADFGGCMKLLQNYPTVAFPRLMHAACQVRDEEARHYEARQTAATAPAPTAAAAGGALAGGVAVAGNGAVGSGGDHGATSGGGGAGAVAAAAAPVPQMNASRHGIPSTHAAMAEHAARALPRPPSLIRNQQEPQGGAGARATPAEGHPAGRASGEQRSLHHAAFASTGVVSPGASEPLDKSVSPSAASGSSSSAAAGAAASAGTGGVAGAARARGASDGVGAAGAASAGPTSFRTASGFEGALASALSSGAADDTGGRESAAFGSAAANAAFARLHGHPAFASPFADERVWERSWEPDEGESEEDGDGGGAFGGSRRVPSRKGSGRLGGAGGGNGQPRNLTSIVKTVSSAFTTTDPFAPLARRDHELRLVGPPQGAAHAPVASSPGGGAANPASSPGGGSGGHRPQGSHAAAPGSGRPL